MAGMGGAQPCRFRQFRRRSHPIWRLSSCICQLAFELTAKPPEAKLDRSEDTKVARAPARFSKSLARWVDMEHAMVELGVRHLHMIGEAEAPLKRAPRILVMQQIVKSSGCATCREDQEGSPQRCGLIVGSMSRDGLLWLGRCDHESREIGQSNRIGIAECEAAPVIYLRDSPFVSGARLLTE